MSNIMFIDFIRGSKSGHPGSEKDLGYASSNNELGDSDGGIGDGKTKFMVLKAENLKVRWQKLLC